MSPVALKTRMTRSGFSPPSLGNLVIWFDASQLVLSDTDPVASWTDLSGFGFHATQATSGNRPLFRTGILNGRPVVRFDGSNDELATGNVFAAGAAKTMVVVGKRSGAGSGVPRLWGLEAAGAGVFDNNPTWGYYANEAGGVVSLGGTIANPSVVTIVWASTSTATGYINGAAGTAFDPNDSYAAQQGLTLGNSATGNPDFWNGDIAEVLYYDRALTGPERQQVERYLGAKWGVVVP